MSQPKIQGKGGWQMEDKSIVSLFFSRKEEALTACQDKYGKYLKTVSYNILRNDEDTEECINDVLLVAWNAIPPTKPASLKHYLATLARNCSLNIYSKKNARKRHGETEELLEEICSFTPDTDDPESLLLAKDLKNTINDFLQTLDQATRVCFVLRYYYALTNEEIAKKTGKSSHAVASLLSKTRGRLKEYLNTQGVTV